MTTHFLSNPSNLTIQAIHCGQQYADHLRTSGLVCARCMTISPKKEFAHANHSLVIRAGLSTEKDSCRRLSLADLTRLARQLRISLLDLEVRICMVSASGQMQRSSVWELPTPLTSPRAQKYLFFSERMNLRVLRQMASSSPTNLRQGRLSRQGRFESSQSRQLPSPSTSYAKISTPLSRTIPCSQILLLIRAECSSIRFDSCSLQDRKTELVGTLERRSLATRARQLEAMALPGMLQGSSLGLSEGRKPVLIMPVQMAGFMTPFGSYSLLRLKVQQFFPNFCQNSESLTCSSNAVSILARALKNLTLKKSICPKRWQYS